MISTKIIVPLFENVNNIPPLNMKDNRSFTPPDPALLPSSTSCCSFSTFSCLLRDLPHTKRMAEGAAEVILSNIPPSHPNSWYSYHTAPPKAACSHPNSLTEASYCHLPALIHPLLIASSLLSTYSFELPRHVFLIVSWRNHVSCCWDRCRGNLWRSADLTEVGGVTSPSTSCCPCGSSGCLCVNSVFSTHVKKYICICVHLWVLWCEYLWDCETKPSIKLYVIHSALEATAEHKHKPLINSYV